jgi:hypothetical protein
MQVQLRAGLPQGEANGLKVAASEFADKDDPRLPFDTEQAIEQAFREFALGTTDSPQQTDHVPGYSNGDQHEQEPPQAGRDFSIDDDPGRDEDGPWPGDPGFSG